jgi:hypothetical protein
MQDSIFKNLRLSIPVVVVCLFLLPSACAVQDDSETNNVVKESDSNILTPQKNVVRCIQYDDMGRNALLARDIQPVLVVFAYSPTPENSGFTVYLLDQSGNVRHAVEHPAIYPSLAFSKDKNHQPHRFSLNISEAGQLLGSTKACFEIEFRQSNKELQGGFAEVALTTQPTK